ncbi:diguanylate cyclase [Ruminococcus sp.]|uniref:diguanylate cyclase domain-containing protein n=1 Tax=Ruminococcus sp. TaxID=41978 RepID=UPI0025DAE4EE|nr:diguanylate cyclase [Ruminococcus sp.]MCR4638676.1 diguanylate cyclase [Ruminococcus sp.]
MSKHETQIRARKRNFIIALSLLLITNILMALTLSLLAKKDLREQIDQRMLDISNTAAYMLNGDELKYLQKEDEGTEPYTRALETLRAFQDNINLDYIYGIRAEADGSFTFTIDPAVEDPGEFGSPIVSTEALRSAANGIAAVDKKAYSDAWGRFYSAYSPVFDSDGKVSGIVGVDFNAEWYNGKLNNHKLISVIILIASLIVGIAVSFVIMSQYRKHLKATLKEIEQLDYTTQRISDSMTQSAIKKLDFLPNSERDLLKTLANGEENKQSYNDEYEEITSNIHSVCNKLNKYIKYMDSNMYRDALTNAMNKAAYRNTIRQLDEDIKNEQPVFSVGFFDLNGLENINARYGFEPGDELMFHSARLLKNVFGNDNVYRVAGDEFIAIMRDKTALDMEEYFDEFDKEVNSFNESKKIAHSLSIAKGFNVYKKDMHENYRQVLITARENMQNDKAEYYRNKKA